MVSEQCQLLFLRARSDPVMSNNQVVARSRGRTQLLMSIGTLSYTRARSLVKGVPVTKNYPGERNVPLAVSATKRHGPFQADCAASPIALVSSRVKHRTPQ
jgi:hypothetical protein